jgi:hypothetical protein
MYRRVGVWACRRVGVREFRGQRVPIRELRTDTDNRQPTTDNYSATGTVLKVETARTEDTEDTEVLKG